jgi:hypothetical protein
MPLRNYRNGFRTNLSQPDVQRTLPPARKSPTPPSSAVGHDAVTPARPTSVPASVAAVRADASGDPAAPVGRAPRRLSSARSPMSDRSSRNSYSTCFWCRSSGSRQASAICGQLLCESYCNARPPARQRAREPKHPRCQYLRLGISGTPRWIDLRAEHATVRLSSQRFRTPSPSATASGFRCAPGRSPRAQVFSTYTVSPEPPPTADLKPWPPAIIGASVSHSWCGRVRDDRRADHRRRAGGLGHGADRRPALATAPGVAFRARPSRRPCRPPDPDYTRQPTISTRPPRRGHPLPCLAVRPPFGRAPGSPRHLLHHPPLYPKFLTVSSTPHHPPRLRPGQNSSIPLPCPSPSSPAPIP